MTTMGGGLVAAEGAAGGAKVLAEGSGQVAAEALVTGLAGGAEKVSHKKSS